MHVITHRNHAILPGDQIRISGDTNRMRRVVAGIESATTFRALLFVRPSKGWAKHIRRVKATQRT